MKSSQKITSMFRAAVHAFIHRGPPGGVFLAMHRASVQARCNFQAETVEDNYPPLALSKESDYIIALTHKCTLSAENTTLVVPIKSQSIASVTNVNNEIVPVKQEALSPSNPSTVSCILEDTKFLGFSALIAIASVLVSLAALCGFVGTSAVQACLLVLQATAPTVQKCIRQIVSEMVVPLKRSFVDSAQQTYIALDRSAFKACEFFRSSALAVTEGGCMIKDSFITFIDRSCVAGQTLHSVSSHWISCVASLIINNATVLTLLLIGCIQQGMTFWPRFYWHLFGPSSNGRSIVEILFNSNPEHYERKSSGVGSEIGTHGAYNYIKAAFTSVAEKITHTLALTVKAATNSLDAVQCSVSLISSWVASEMNKSFATAIEYLSSFHDDVRGCFTMLYHRLIAETRSATNTLTLMMLKSIDGSSVCLDTVRGYFTMVCQHSISATYYVNNKLKLMAGALRVFQDTVRGSFTAKHHYIIAVIRSANDKFKLIIDFMADDIRVIRHTVRKRSVVVTCSVNAKLKILLAADNLRTITVQGCFMMIHHLSDAATGSVVDKFTLSIATSIDSFQAFLDSVRECFTAMHHDFVSAKRFVDTKLVRMPHYFWAFQDTVRGCITMIYHRSTTTIRSATAKFTIVRTTDSLRAFRGTVQGCFRTMYYQSVAAACFVDTELKLIIAVMANTFAATCSVAAKINLMSDRKDESLQSFHNTVQGCFRVVCLQPVTATCSAKDKLKLSIVLEANALWTMCFTAICHHSIAAKRSVISKVKLIIVLEADAQDTFWRTATRVHHLSVAVWHTLVGNLKLNTLAKRGLRVCRDIIVWRLIAMMHCLSRAGLHFTPCNLKLIICGDTLWRAALVMHCLSVAVISYSCILSNHDEPILFPWLIDTATVCVAYFEASYLVLPEAIQLTSDFVWRHPISMASATLMAWLAASTSEIVRECLSSLSQETKWLCRLMLFWLLFGPSKARSMLAILRHLTNPSSGDRLSTRHLDRTSSTRHPSQDCNQLASDTEAHHAWARIAFAHITGGLAKISAIIRSWLKVIRDVASSACEEMDKPLCLLLIIHGTILRAIALRYTTDLYKLRVGVSILKWQANSLLGSKCSLPEWWNPLRPCCLQLFPPVVWQCRHSTLSPFRRIHSTLYFPRWFGNVAKPTHYFESSLQSSLCGSDRVFGCRSCTFLSY